MVAYTSEITTGFFAARSIPLTPFLTPTSDHHQGDTPIRALYGLRLPHFILFDRPYWGFSRIISEIPHKIRSIVKWKVLVRNKPALTNPIGLNPFFRMTWNQWRGDKNWFGALDHF
jgi:hypothetical protein